MCVRELIARNWLQSIGRYSDMYSNTRIMQTALPVLHNALCLSGLSHANELEMMEPSQVDGNLPLAWPWNICDSSNIIDAAKVQKRDGWGAKSQDGGWDRVIPGGLAGNNAAHEGWCARRSWAHLFSGANGVLCLVKYGYPCSRRGLESNLGGITESDWELLLNTEFGRILENFPRNAGRICRVELQTRSDLSQHDCSITATPLFSSVTPILFWYKCDLYLILFLQL